MRSNFSDLLATGRLHVWELAPHAQELVALCPLASASAAGGGGGGGDGWCEAAVTAPAWRIPRSEVMSRWPDTYDLVYHLPLSPAFLAAIPSRQFLIFQPDGLLCRMFSAAYLEQLRKFDLVGAPWSFMRAEERGGTGGNGGFTFRTKALVARILEHVRGGFMFDVPFVPQLRRGGENEDMFLSYWVRAARWRATPLRAHPSPSSLHVLTHRAQMQRVGGALPTFDFAASFSVETVFAPESWGYHKPWAYLGGEQFQSLVARCPVIAEASAWNKWEEPFDTSSIASCRGKPGGAL